MGPKPKRPSSGGFPQPQLSVAWESPGRAFRESLAAFFLTPKPWKNGPSIANYFRDTDLKSYWPSRAFLASILWHVVFVGLAVLPIWQFSSGQSRPTRGQVEITWNQPSADLPPIAFTDQRPQPVRSTSRSGAYTYHPRQTILSMPAHPTHPRQTLIQPGAPPTPPKIAPQLPNIVEWSQTAGGAQPKLPVAPASTPHIGAQSRPADIAAPDIGADARTSAGQQELRMSANGQHLAAPKMPAGSSAGPRNTATRHTDAGPAPDLGPVVAANDTGRKVIALSANPAPPAPDVSIPSGNLSARISMSPEGPKPGQPGGSSSGAPGAMGGTGAQASTGISISGGNPKAAASLTGPASGESGAPLKAPYPAGGSASSSASNVKPAPAPINPARTQPSVGMEQIDAGTTPEQILGAKRVYKIYVNMPNLTSATGSWELDFAELLGDDPPGQTAAEISGPVPVRKVDPKYPPTLIHSHVEGEVVLYAIIRRDGSVDSIQLLKGVDPQLDQNAMEAFTRWKFLPATRGGVPVDLEAVVHIPFRTALPY